MTDTARFWRKKCKQVTVHELNESWSKARCTACAKAQRELKLHEEQYSPDARHWAALDGMGNRGEPPPPKALMRRKEEKK